MSMIKFVSPAGWDFDRHIAVPVKISSRGLIGEDRRAFLKTASNVFLDKLADVKFGKDMLPVHLIALGSSEAYGPNRNGDGFKEAECRKHHSTFVKFARFFNHHKNKPERGDPHYGEVKQSAYNDKMRRVELLAGLYTTKEAAEAGKGLVDETALHKLASGEDIGVSMACKIDHDVCSWCKHASATRDEYCTSNTCDAGGCKDKLSQIVKIGGDIHHLHVDNPSPLWFDISRVVRPADRIAYGSQAKYLDKEAADQSLSSLKSEFELSKSASAPLSVLLYESGRHGVFSARLEAMIKLGYGLAAMEKVREVPNLAVDRALSLSAFPIEKLAEYGTPRCESQLAALADQQIILSFRDFAAMLGRDKSAASLLPGLFNETTNDESLLNLIEKQSTFLTGTTSSADRLMAAELSSQHSLKVAAVTQRGILASVANRPTPSEIGFEKRSSAPGNLDTLRQYAQYKLAALCRIAEFDDNFPLTVRFALRQNQIQLS